MALDEIGESRFPPPGRTPCEDTAAVMKFYRLPKAFPPAALEEALPLLLEEGSPVVSSGLETVIVRDLREIEPWIRQRTELNEG